ncbi:MAG: acyl-CoA thioesterase [Sphingomonadales bacterium]|nr:acyl-CoA thioesterase [Sphingomonadales bacterium]PIX67237.1 MAG: thioesterase [Sphingomonadales bacterium CG_4_10_14_3_um_filter_58_15]NCO48676.1 acyl-CoA thioesterase [Sphingomonadales bacterium]NCO99579.1 acyl-CoA thioesterase [Sphingomonadales bacterium]NCP25951.1 acyl-CoA thioesterase [Sphingomonadales bacterium]
MSDAPSPQGVGESGYTLSITAQPSDIDELGHVNNAVWVRWIQELATAHWNAIAPQDAIDRYIWVVTRHEIDYRGNVGVGDSVTGRTWISEPPKGARFWRNVSFTGPDGKIKVAAKTNWAIIDRTIERPVRVPADLAELFLKN